MTCGIGRAGHAPRAHRTGRRAAPLLALAAAALLAAVPSAQERPRHGRLFPPEELGVLEGPDRDAWQQPGRIMDALGIADGAVVADVGAGGGWFTIRLARRVGPNGLVFAEDVQREMIDSIERRVRREGLANARPILGRDDDAGLPRGSLDAVLLVDAYHEVQDPVGLLRHIAAALKPNGRLGIVDFRSDGGGPGPPADQRVDAASIVRDAQEAGLRVLAEETFLPYQFLLVLGH
jgi:predicted methyltransferase